MTVHSHLLLGAVEVHGSTDEFCRKPLKDVAMAGRIQMPCSAKERRTLGPKR